MTDPKPSPASLRQLADKLQEYRDESPEYSSHGPEHIAALRTAADRIEEQSKLLDDLTIAASNVGYERDSLRQQLTAAQSEARFQKERADGYSGWITEFEKREARLREALRRAANDLYYADLLGDYEAARKALEVDGEHE